MLEFGEWFETTWYFKPGSEGGAKRASGTSQAERNWGWAFTGPEAVIWEMCGFHDKNISAYHDEEEYKEYAFQDVKDGGAGWLNDK